MEIITTLALPMNMPELVRTLLSVLFPDRLSATADRFNSDLAYGIPQTQDNKKKHTSKCTLSIKIKQKKKHQSTKKNQKSKSTHRPSKLITSN